MASCFLKPTSSQCQMTNLNVKNLGIKCCERIWVELLLGIVATLQPLGLTDRKGSTPSFHSNHEQELYVGIYSLIAFSVRRGLWVRCFLFFTHDYLGLEPSIAYSQSPKLHQK